MRDLINTTTDKMMLYNARTVNGKQMQDFVGDEFSVTDIVQYETERKNTKEPELGICTVLFTEEGEMYTTMSPTVNDCVQNLVEILVYLVQNILSRCRLHPGLPKAIESFYSLRQSKTHFYISANYEGRESVPYLI